MVETVEIGVKLPMFVETQGSLVGFGDGQKMGSKLHSLNEPLRENQIYGAVPLSPCSFVAISSCNFLSAGSGTLCYHA
jgi:hypothetical protein